MLDKYPYMSLVYLMYNNKRAKRILLLKMEKILNNK